MPPPRVQARWMHGPRRDLRFVFREPTLSLRSSYHTSHLASTRTTTFSSYPSFDGMGSHLARFLYVLGECVLDLLSKLVIRMRLMAISHSLKQASVVPQLAREDKHEMRSMCDDLVELCRCSILSHAHIPNQHK
jgi:hypothetical protein